MKKELCLILVVLMESLCQQSGFCASDRIALVIGNQQYGENVADSLTNPVNDANAISEALSQVGFEVIKKTNLNRSDMYNSINEFGRKIEQNDATVALFYYSGHAAQIDGKNYLMPVSFDFNRIQYESEAKEQSIDAGLPLEIMEYARSKTKIMILDACRNNRFKKSRSAGGGDGLAAMKIRGGSLIAFSTSPGSTANDLGDGNSIYTKSLIKNLKTIGEPISSIFEAVTADVAEESNETQEPWYHSSLRGKGRERFYFIPPNNTPDVTTSPRNNLSNNDKPDEFFPLPEEADAPSNKPDAEQHPKPASPQGGRTIGQYIDHGNGTITDTKSGLMWKRCSEGLSGVNCEKGETEKYKWDDAVERFKNAAYAGYSDWRLPTIDELKTLVRCSNGVLNEGNGLCEAGSENPTINQQAFPNTQASVVWSGSPLADDSGRARHVDFYYGGSYFGIRVDAFAVRLVRGGQ